MDLHKLTVEVTARIDKLKKTFDEVKSESAKTMSEANKQLAKIGDENKFASKITRQWDDARKQTESTMKKIQQIAKQSKIDAGLIEPTKEYQTLTKDIQAAEKELDKLRAKASAMSGNGDKEMTAGYSTVMRDIKSTEERLDSLIDKQQEWVRLGVDTKSSSFKRLDDEIEDARKELDGYIAKQKSMESSGKAYSYTDKWKSLQREITAAGEKVKQYRAQESQMASQGKDYVKTDKAKNYYDGKAALAQVKGFGAAGVKEIGQTIKELSRLHPSLAKAMRLAQSFGNTARKAFNAGSKAAKVLYAPLKTSTGFLKILGTGFGTVLTKLKAIVPAINRTNRSMNSMYGSGSRLSRMWSTLKMTAGFMAASFVIMGSVNSAKEGFKNLSQYSGQTNADLSMLMSSLTQLKNSFATAFAPILTVVAPILNNLIGWVSSAATAVAHFFGALTGQNTVTVAKQVTQDFASSVTETGNAATDANSKAEKLKRTLMGFDQINKLDAADNNSSGTSGSKISPAEMFTTEEVDGVSSGWAQKVKDAWAEADFTDIGKTLGEKLNKSLNEFSWTKINTTLQKIAKSAATGLNGFIETTDWELVGETFAGGVNTLINAGYTFVTTFDWKKFGTAIANSINGFIAELDLTKAGASFSAGIKGILNTINTVLTETDWKAIGQKVGNFLANVDWIGVLASVGTAIVNAVVGLLDFADGLFTSISEGLKNVDWKKVIEEVWGLIKTSWGLVEKVFDVGINLIKNGWSVLKSWLGINDKGEDQKINRKKGWTNTIRSFLGLEPEGQSKTQKIDRKKGWTNTIRSFLGLEPIGESKTQLIDRKKGWTKGIKEWLGIDKPLEIILNLPKLSLKEKKAKVASWLELEWSSSYATGGFPEEGPFFMNRGEIAGRFSNGKGVVANNQQITAGISNAVGPAVYEAVLSAMMQGGGNNGNVTIVLEGDARGLFKAVKKEADSYTQSTGQSAFAY